jgi:hypothetical protein
MNCRDAWQGVENCEALYRNPEELYRQCLVGTKKSRLGLPFLWIQKTSKNYPWIPELAMYLILRFPTQHWSR